jgi:hypothetical protein
LVKIKDLPTLTGANTDYFIPAQNAAGSTRKIAAGDLSGGGGGGLTPWIDVQGGGDYYVSYGQRLCVELNQNGATIFLPDDAVPVGDEIWIAVLNASAFTSGIKLTVVATSTVFRDRVPGQHLEIANQDWLIILRKFTSGWAVFNLPPTGAFSWTTN